MDETEFFVGLIGVSALTLLLIYNGKQQNINTLAERDKRIEALQMEVKAQQQKDKDWSAAFALRACGNLKNAERAGGFGAGKGSPIYEIADKAVFDISSKLEQQDEIMTFRKMEGFTKEMFEAWQQSRKIADVTAVVNKHCAAFTR